MKTPLAVVLACVVAATASPVFAQASAPAKPAATTTNTQQERMKTCNENAANLKGDERKTYMSACLSGKESPKPLTAQQQRMKTCNERAGGMKGDERKKFMSECLKG